MPRGLAPGLYPITVVATRPDDTSLAGSEVIYATVFPAGPGVVIVPIADQEAARGTTFQMAILAFDTAGDGSGLTLGLGPEAPAGLEIDATTGELTWAVPQDFPTGEYPVTVVARDPAAGATASADFTILVTAADPGPAFVPVPDQAVPAGATLIVATPLANDLGQSPLYFLDGAPAGTDIDESGTLTWSVPKSQAPGDYTITILAFADPHSTEPLTTTVKVQVLAVAPAIAPVHNVDLRQGANGLPGDRGERPGPGRSARLPARRRRHRPAPPSTTGPGHSRSGPPPGCGRDSPP